MITSPCLKCERKGCGSHHDMCEKYQEYAKNNNTARRKKQKDAYIRQHNDYFEPRKRKGGTGQR